MPNPTGQNKRRDPGKPVIIRDFPADLRRALRFRALTEETTMRQLIIDACRVFMAGDDGK